MGLCNATFSQCVDTPVDLKTYVFGGEIAAVRGFQVSQANKDQF